MEITLLRQTPLCVQLSSNTFRYLSMNWVSPRVSPWTAGQMADNDGCHVDPCGFKLGVLLRVIAKMMHSGYGGLQLFHRQLDPEAGCLRWHQISVFR